MSSARMILTSPNWLDEDRGSLHEWQSVEGFRANNLKPGFSSTQLSAMRGNWTVVEDRENEVVIATDICRSHPIAYAFIEGRWVITDDVEKLRPLLDFKPNTAQIETFANSALSFGQETLIENVYSTPAATLITLKDDGSAASEPLIDFHFSPTPITDPEEFANRFSNALDVVFGRLLEKSSSRELVIPLSGGLDSRLVAVWLKKLGAPKVTCFTYGKPGSAESKISAEVAADLDLDWHYVSMETEEVRRAWAGDETDDFLRSTWKGTSLPHVQDWYALRMLRLRKTISPDSIFLPGHTIVGNMHDEELASGVPELKKLQRAMLKHHLNMQGRWKKAALLDAVKKQLSAAIATLDKNSPRAVQELFEWFNVSQRQAKYINNSMSSYEHFGYSWALPMLDREVVDAWLSGSAELTLTRDWYSKFVAEEFAKETGREIQLFEPPSTKMPEPLKKLMLAIIRATKINVLLERYRSFKTVTNHPMAFEAFTDFSEKEQFSSIMTGANQLGFWTESFLNNSWGGQGIIVPKAG